jgi:hypothetical protein
MFDLFLNPWAMAAGTMLISSPIIIHLINRLRYRRIRWAAMEFLLKSQKRNRRRIIIEQIILLLLRILLVLLAGFLLARFLGELSGPQQNTMHVVLLDDTPSMADFHREEGQQLDAFRQAKKVIVEQIAKHAGDATTPQGLILLRLSDLSSPRKIDRLNAGSVEELKSFLADVECSNVHTDLARGLDEAQAVFEQYPQERRLLHIVSDLRARDWTGAPSDSIRQAIEHLKQTKVDIHLIDAAYPVRNEQQRTVLYHDNLAIVDFQPETRVVARYMPVEFSVGVANYSNSERKNVRVTVRVKGQERAEGSFTMPSAAANAVTIGTFMVAFDQLGPNPVSANLENEEAGLAIDNVRHAAVEVREKVPLLIVEGDVKTKGTSEGDGYYLKSLFSESTRGFDVVMRGAADLEKLNLEVFPSIFLLNVPRFSDAAVKKLEEYVRKGGGACFALGPEVKPDFYNKLYDGGNGLFPAPLAERPTEGIGDAGARLVKMFSNPMPKVYPRNVGHAVFTRIYRDERTRTYTRENDKYLIFADIDRYWPVPRSKWSEQPGKIDELMTLPNNKQISDYADQAGRILRDLPIEDADYAKYRPALDAHRKAIQQVLLQGGELYKLAGPLDQMLNDTGDPKEPEKKPNLQEFWQQGGQAGLREQVVKLLEAVRFGDPFLIARTFGKGRVLAYMTTVSDTWNDLPKGPARVYYVMLMVEMQKYLAAVNTDTNLTLGAPLDLELDAGRYETKVRRYFPPKLDLSGRTGPAKSTRVDAGEQTGEVNDKRLLFRFNEARIPGVYEFVLNRKDSPSEAGKPEKPDAPKVDPETARQETLSFAFNVDALAESDLRRASTDDLAAVAPNVPLHLPDGESLTALLKQKKSDVSESIWLYLVFLLVLIAEQAMAVRLSYHTRGAEAGV